MRHPIFSLLLSIGLLNHVHVRGDSIREDHIPEDLNGSNFTYPWPVKLYQFTTQHAQTLEMAFMDVAPTSTPNNKTAVLLHGKNFCGPTWNATAIVLTQAGYRVILPEQIGFCKSSKPVHYQFSLQQLAYNTIGLLKALNIGNITLIGHSMGGMLSTRLSLMYPENITELVLVNPIGLEDWKALGVPWQELDITWAIEAASNYTTIRAYEQSTYYVNTWNSSYDIWVNMLNNIYHGSQAKEFTWDQALTTDAVLTQPVVYEFPLLKPKTLLMIGAKDNTAIGKAWSPPDVQAKLGHYNVLGKQVAAMINGSTLIEFPDLGHAPQIEEPDTFHAALMGWLSE
ncbi:alpha/beta-hydrolase [Mollisia scopiformis]|uniref:Alpha/beta-hydrolase n=1 Tax=Mollisia scopiformis TaxID=149040 RepID=A0A132B381_MOLSC|nr:alpha/beta-hydrolase [Mollisia scopiformis]KUJ06852.1 alpha/beta-hydrolase [Mollisia scopiformis]